MLTLALISFNIHVRQLKEQEDNDHRRNQQNFNFFIGGGWINSDEVQERDECKEQNIDLSYLRADSFY